MRNEVSLRYSNRKTLYLCPKTFLTMQIIKIMKLKKSGEGGALYDFPYSTNNQDVKALSFCYENCCCWS